MCIVLCPWRAGEVGGPSLHVLCAVRSLEAILVQTDVFPGVCVVDDAPL